MLKNNKVLCLAILLHIIVNTSVYAQKGTKNGWFYQDKRDTFFCDFSVYTLEYYKEGELISSQKYTSSRIDEGAISSASFYTPNAVGTKKNQYIWDPYRGQIYLSVLDFSSEKYDSSYYFHFDGMSIKAISYAERLNKPEQRFELGERYLFNFPSPIPDTLPAFFEKVKQGCPYTPCNEQTINNEQ